MPNTIPADVEQKVNVLLAKAEPILRAEATDGDAAIILEGDDENEPRLTFAAPIDIAKMLVTYGYETQADLVVEHAGKGRIVAVTCLANGDAVVSMITRDPPAKA